MVRARPQVRVSPNANPTPTPTPTPDPTPTPNPDSTRYYLFTHLDFSIAYNDRHIIEVNVSADPLQRVDLGQHVRKLEFSYSVKWLETSTPLAERMSRLGLGLGLGIGLGIGLGLGIGVGVGVGIGVGLGLGLGLGLDPNRDLPCISPISPLHLARYAQYSFLPQSFEIHWLSIINSFVLVRPCPQIEP